MNIEDLEEINKVIDEAGDVAQKHNSDCYDEWTEAEAYHIVRDYYKKKLEEKKKLSV